MTRKTKISLLIITIYFIAFFLFELFIGTARTLEYMEECVDKRKQTFYECEKRRVENALFVFRHGFVFRIFNNRKRIVDGICIRSVRRDGYFFVVE